jgi:hypothetical protein
MIQQYDGTPHGNAVINSIDFQDGAFIRTQITIPLQEGNVGLGRPVTAAAAKTMISAYAKQAGDPNETIAVEFGRETLLYLLSQKGCESVRFYFCINQDKVKSIVAIPIDANGDMILLEGKSGTTTLAALTASSGTSDSSTSVLGVEVGGKHLVSSWPVS